MSISGQNLSVVIVTLKSEKIIDRCINSINKNLPIIVVENSNNLEFKSYLENNYKNVQCILSKENVGTGAGYNVGIKLSKTDYVYAINPDITLEANALDEIFLASEQLSDFSILSPIIVIKIYGYKSMRCILNIGRNGSPGRIRTAGQAVNSRLLYR